MHDRNLVATFFSRMGDTLVFKKLQVSTTEMDIREYLHPIGFSDVSVEVLSDEAGRFKGTVFVRFPTEDICNKALLAISQNSVINGKKFRVQYKHHDKRNRANSAKDTLEADPDSDLAKVRNLIVTFLNSPDMECYLPDDLTPEQRKAAHSLSEKFGLKHITADINGGIDPSPKSATSSGTGHNRRVFISKNSKSFLMKAGSTLVADALSGASPTSSSLTNRSPTGSTS